MSRVGAEIEGDDWRVVLSPAGVRFERGDSISSTVTWDAIGELASLGGAAEDDSEGGNETMRNDNPDQLPLPGVPVPEKPKHRRKRKCTAGCGEFAYGIKAGRCEACRAAPGAAATETGGAT